MKAIAYLKGYGQKVFDASDPVPRIMIFPCDRIIRHDRSVCPSVPEYARIRCELEGVIGGVAIYREVA